MHPDRGNPVRRRVLLANLNGYDQPYPVYPLGIAYLDGGLREAGHQTRIWDAHVSPERLEEAVAAFAPDYIALSMRNVDNVQYHNPRSFVDELLEACRRARGATDARLIVGGSGFSVFPRELFGASCADYGIHGEGEASFPQLIEALETGGPLEGVSGLLYRRADGTIQMNACSARDTAFCTVPWHDEAILRAYSAKGSLPGVQTQRGCPLRCCYCTYPSIEGKRSRYRTGEEIVEEMRRLLAMGTNFTFLVDSVFNTRADHVIQVCEALARADLGMEWQCFLRPRNVSRDLLKLMRRAGLRHVEFGSDSFSDPVLKRYGKSFTWEEIRQASLDAQELDIRYSHFLIFGGPGETPDSVEETIARAQSLPGAFYFATIGMRIYPDTPLWRQLNPEARGETAGDYLHEPRFFLEPPFTVGGLFGRLARHRDAYHNWVIGDPPPSFLETVGKLRARGVRGPMWEYIATLQRFARHQEKSKLPAA
ncbi:MAG TPA: radical SAM protein [Opitutaceae bacterium]|nr:radical SAM protein [Opitutaceae bacterium]